MKKLAYYIILAAIAISVSNCTKDNEIEELDLVWGYTWEPTYLKSIDLNSGREAYSIAMNRFVEGSENLVYNEIKNEMLFTAFDSLYSINLETKDISLVSFIGDSVFGLRLDTENQMIYGLIVQDAVFQFLRINISGSSINRTISQINVPELNHLAGTALNTNDGKFYFCVNDSLYSFNLQENRIEKSIQSNITNIEYNSLSNELIGIGSVNYKHSLLKLNSELSDVKTIEFSEDIQAYTFASTINKKNGNYIFKGNGYVMHVVNIKTGMIESINAVIETGYEFQSK